MSQPDPAEGGSVDAPAIITPSLLHSWPLPRPGQNGGKESRGRVLVVGGSQSTPGAVLLAGVGALRVGAGKLQMATAETAATALAIAVPEAGVVGLPLLDQGLPGVDDDASLVLDALALTCGALTQDLLHRFGGRVVITPNEAEMHRILDALGGDSEDDAEGLDLAVKGAEALGVVVAYEGAVATPDGRCWRDGTGNAGLGTSGSGDVLAGVAVGLLARGADPAQAAAWAVHLHGSAGDAMAAPVGRLGFLASELLDQVPRILASLEV